MDILQRTATMDTMIVNAVGAAAACLTTLCWLPQAMRIIRTRDTSSISLLAYAAFGAGVFLWLVYGLLAGSWPVIAANAITLIPIAAIIGLKLRLG